MRPLTKKERISLLFAYGTAISISAMYFTGTLSTLIRIISR
jgi:hypothetical protein